MKKHQIGYSRPQNEKVVDYKIKTTEKVQEKSISSSRKSLIPTIDKAAASSFLDQIEKEMEQLIMHNGSGSGPQAVKPPFHPDPTPVAPKPKNSKRLKSLWKELFDEKSGRSYFHNRLSKVTTWTRPSDEELEKMIDANNEIVNT